MVMFAADVLQTAQEIKDQGDMAVQIKNLAETVRQAKAAIDGATLN